MTQLLTLGGIASLAVLGLVIANALRDRGVDPPISRRIAGFLGGGAYLVAVLALEAWPAAVLSGTMAMVVLLLRLRFRAGLRGVTGGAFAQRWGEVAFPIAGAASLVVGWGILGDRWLAFLPIAFIAWGDNAAGFLRGGAVAGLETGPWPSAAMLAVCLAAAAAYQPYWIGAIGAVAATVVERSRPTASPLWDDNWAIVAASLLVMAPLSSLNLTGT